MDIRIAKSGETTINAISHWYLDADANMINFLFRLDCENDFLRDLFDDDGFVDTGVGEAGEIVGCALMTPSLSSNWV